MIDYQLINDCENWWRDKGFTKVQVPWTVTQQIMEITCPEDVTPLKLEHEDGKCLIGSGEQGFLYQLSKGYLPWGKYVTTTPCFRQESHDVLHQKNFMKTELIIVGNTLNSVLEKMVEDAMEFFELVWDGVELETLKTSGTSIDIIGPLGVELGSYGIRHHRHLSWIYGTGIAEPRFSNLRSCDGLS